MNIVDLFISGKLFLLFFLIAGIAALLFSRSKKYYEQTTTNHGIEYANKTIKMLRIGGPILILCSVLMFILFISEK